MTVGMFIDIRFPEGDPAPPRAGTGGTSPRQRIGPEQHKTGADKDDGRRRA